MLFRFFIAALAINFACSSAAHAKGCGNDLADAKRRVTGISRNVAATIGLFEQVPPDVAAYIDAESREASAQGNQERLDIVTRHPFYRAHRIAVAHQKLAANLSRVEQQSQRQHVAYLLANALIDHSDLYDAVYKYLDLTHPARNAPYRRPPGRRLLAI